eukprot:104572-Pleurochrysis_carterae.AAC.1
MKSAAEAVPRVARNAERETARSKATTTAEKGKKVTSQGKARGVPAPNSNKVIAARRTRSTATSEAGG